MEYASTTYSIQNRPKKSRTDFRKWPHSFEINWSISFTSGKLYRQFAHFRKQIERFKRMNKYISSALAGWIAGVIAVCLLAYAQWRKTTQEMANDTPASEPSN